MNSLKRLANTPCIFTLGVALMVFLFSAGPLYAGNIISGYNIASWERADLGQVNFATSQGDVTVTNSALTGYAWGEDVGWINLAPTNGGVANNGDGVLSGYAWGENAGWINFAPTNGGVIITEIASNVGEFSGFAWSQNYGWLEFDNVRTTWTPATTDTGGGGGPIIIPPPPPPPPPIPGPDDPTSGGIVDGCGDGLDNDGDGVADEFDPACHTDGDPNNPASFDPNIDSENSRPVITLLGLGTIEIDTGSTFTDPGYSAFDVEDGDITSRVQVEGSVNINVVGEYEIRYTVTDSFGETYIVVRRVIVQKASLLTDLTDLLALARDAFFNALGTLERIINTPTGARATKTVSTTGLLVGLFASLGTLFANPLSLAELFFIPLRVGTLLASFFGFRRRYKPWGVVYDAVTKQPLDPAYVTLSDMNGKEIESSITDLDGRFGFLVEPGRYILRAEKTHYKFPSQVLAGKTSDELYPSLYFGEEIEITENSRVISKNIPMDPLNFDWNEFAKGDQKLMQFYSKHDKFILRIVDALFYVGLVIAVVALFAAPSPYNYIIFGLYLLLIVIRLLGLSVVKKHGKIVEQSTGKPLSYAIVRVITADAGNQVLKTVCDKYGRYFALISNGEYKVEIEEKIGDNEYQTVYTSQTIKITEGILTKNFKIY